MKEKEIADEIVKQHLMTSEEKLDLWGYGEWVEEPDSYSFTYNDRKCEIIRNLNLGNFCGYTQLKDHENIKEDEIELEVYGGITYCEKYLRVPRKISLPDSVQEVIDIYLKYGNFIGIDFGHAQDLTPRLKKAQWGCYQFMLDKYKEEASWIKTPTYKNLEFATEKTKQLVDGLNFLVKRLESKGGSHQNS